MSLMKWYLATVIFCKLVFCSKIDKKAVNANSLNQTTECGIKLNELKEKRVFLVTSLDSFKADFFNTFVLTVSQTAIKICFDETLSQCIFTGLDMQRVLTDQELIYIMHILFRIQDRLSLNFFQNTVLFEEFTSFRYKGVLRNMLIDLKGLMGCNECTFKDFKNFLRNKPNLCEFSKSLSTCYQQILDPQKFQEELKKILIKQIYLSFDEQQLPLILEYVETSNVITGGKFSLSDIKSFEDYTKYIINENPNADILFIIHPQIALYDLLSNRLEECRFSLERSDVLHPNHNCLNEMDRLSDFLKRKINGINKNTRSDEYLNSCMKKSQYNVSVLLLPPLIVKEGFGFQNLRIQGCFDSKKRLSDRAYIEFLKRACKYSVTYFKKLDIFTPLVPYERVYDVFSTPGYGVLSPTFDCINKLQVSLKSKNIIICYRELVNDLVNPLKAVSIENLSNENISIIQKRLVSREKNILEFINADSKIFDRFMRNDGFIEQLETIFKSEDVQSMCHEDILAGRSRLKISAVDICEILLRKLKDSEISAYESTLQDLHQVFNDIGCHTPFFADLVSYYTALKELNLDFEDIKLPNRKNAQLAHQYTPEGLSGFHQKKAWFFNDKDPVKLKKVKYDHNFQKKSAKKLERIENLEFEDSSKRIKSIVQPNGSIRERRCKSKNKNKRQNFTIDNGYDNPVNSDSNDSSAEKPGVIRPKIESCPVNSVFQNIEQGFSSAVQEITPSSLNTIENHFSNRNITSKEYQMESLGGESKTSEKSPDGFSSQHGLSDKRISVAIATKNHKEQISSGNLLTKKKIPLTRLTDPGYTEDHNEYLVIGSQQTDHESSLEISNDLETTDNLEGEFSEELSNLVDIISQTSRMITSLDSLEKDGHPNFIKLDQKNFKKSRDSLKKILGHYISSYSAMMIDEPDSIDIKDFNISTPQSTPVLDSNKQISHLKKKSIIESDLDKDLEIAVLNTKDLCLNETAKSQENFVINKTEEVQLKKNDKSQKTDNFISPQQKGLSKQAHSLKDLFTTDKCNSKAKRKKTNKSRYSKQSKADMSHAIVENPILVNVLKDNCQNSHMVYKHLQPRSDNDMNCNQAFDKNSEDSQNFNAKHPQSCFNNKRTLSLVFKDSTGNSQSIGKKPPQACLKHNKRLPDHMIVGSDTETEISDSSNTFWQPSLKTNQNTENVLESTTKGGQQDSLHTLDSKTGTKISLMDFEKKVPEQIYSAQIKSIDLEETKMQNFKTTYQIFGDHFDQMMIQSAAAFHEIVASKKMLWDIEKEKRKILLEKGLLKEEDFGAGKDKYRYTMEDHFSNLDILKQNNFFMEKYASLFDIEKDGDGNMLETPLSQEKLNSMGIRNLPEDSSNHLKNDSNSELLEGNITFEGTLCCKKPESEIDLTRHNFHNYSTAKDFDDLYSVFIEKKGESNYLNKDIENHCEGVDLQKKIKGSPGNIKKYGLSADDINAYFASLDPSNCHEISRGSDDEVTSETEKNDLDILIAENKKRLEFLEGCKEYVTISEKEIFELHKRNYTRALSQEREENSFSLTSVLNLLFGRDISQGESIARFTTASIPIIESNSIIQEFHSYSNECSNEGETQNNTPKGNCRKLSNYELSQRNTEVTTTYLDIGSGFDEDKFINMLFDFGPSSKPQNFSSADNNFVCDDHKNLGPIHEQLESVESESNIDLTKHSAITYMDMDSSNNSKNSYLLGKKSSKKKKNRKNKPLLNICAPSMCPQTEIKRKSPSLLPQNNSDLKLDNSTLLDSTQTQNNEAITTREIKKPCGYSSNSNNGNSLVNTGLTKSRLENDTTHPDLQLDGLLQPNSSPKDITNTTKKLSKKGRRKAKKYNLMLNSIYRPVGMVEDPLCSNKIGEIAEKKLQNSENIKNGDSKRKNNITKNIILKTGLDVNENTQKFSRMNNGLSEGVTSPVIPSSRKLSTSSKVSKSNRFHHDDFNDKNDQNKTSITETKSSNENSTHFIKHETIAKKSQKEAEKPSMGITYGFKKNSKHQNIKDSQISEKTEADLSQFSNNNLKSKFVYHADINPTSGSKNHSSIKKLSIKMIDLKNIDCETCPSNETTRTIIGISEDLNPSYESNNTIPSTLPQIMSYSDALKNTLKFKDDSSRELPPEKKTTSKVSKNGVSLFQRSDHHVINHDSEKKSTRNNFSSTKMNRTHPQISDCLPTTSENPIFQIKRGFQEVKEANDDSCRRLPSLNYNQPPNTDVSDVILCPQSNLKALNVENNNSNMQYLQNTTSASSPEPVETHESLPAHDLAKAKLNFNEEDIHSKTNNIHAISISNVHSNSKNDDFEPRESQPEKKENISENFLSSSLISTSLVDEITTADTSQPSFFYLVPSEILNDLIRTSSNHLQLKNVKNSLPIFIKGHSEKIYKCAENIHEGDPNTESALNKNVIMNNDYQNISNAAQKTQNKQETFTAISCLNDSKIESQTFSENHRIRDSTEIYIPNNIRKKTIELISPEEDHEPATLHSKNKSSVGSFNKKNPDIKILRRLQNPSESAHIYHDDQSNERFLPLKRTSESPYGCINRQSSEKYMSLNGPVESASVCYNSQSSGIYMPFEWRGDTLDDRSMIDYKAQVYWYLVPQHTPSTVSKFPSTNSATPHQQFAFLQTDEPFSYNDHISYPYNTNFDFGHPPFTDPFLSYNQAIYSNFSSELNDRVSIYGLDQTTQNLVYQRKTGIKTLYMYFSERFFPSQYLSNAFAFRYHDLPDSSSKDQKISPMFFKNERNQYLDCNVNNSLKIYLFPERPYPYRKDDIVLVQDRYNSNLFFKCSRCNDCKRSKCFDYIDMGYIIFPKYALYPPLMIPELIPRVDHFVYFEYTCRDSTVIARFLKKCKSLEISRVKTA